MTLRPTDTVRVPILMLISNISNKNTLSREHFLTYLHFFFGHHQNHTEAKLEYTTTFEQHQVQKYLMSNYNTLMKAKLSARFSNSTVQGDFVDVGTPFDL